MSEEQRNILNIVTEVLSESLGVHPGDITPEDHLEDDLLLDINVKLPELISKVSLELDLDIESDTISEFIKEVKSDPQKGTVAELVALIKEEQDFN